VGSVLSELGKKDNSISVFGEKKKPAVKTPQLTKGKTNLQQTKGPLMQL